MIGIKGLKLLLIVTLVFLGSSCLGAVKAEEIPAVIGKYPVCEPSAAVEVTCPNSEKGCLLVGDNEINKSVYLYPLNSDKLAANQQKEISLNKRKISDLEAIAKLDDNKVLIFGSYSRNSQCQIKKNRGRFLQARVMSDRLEPIGEIIQAPKIDSQVLFQGLDVESNIIFKAVSEAIALAEEAANSASRNKAQCAKTNSFNIEGAVAVPQVKSVLSVWLGLRSPLVSLKQKDYAILLHLQDLNEYQFDGVALLNLGGRGIRELTFSKDWIWGIAGGPEDDKYNFVLWKFPVQSLKPNAIIEPQIVRSVPPSSEGLTIIDSKAYILIDGDLGKSSSQCKIPGKFLELGI